MTKKEAVKEFRNLFAELFTKKDRPAIDQAWNDWTDGLCKDKQITQKQYDTGVHPF